jgi:hypothetical protein
MSSAGLIGVNAVVQFGPGAPAVPRVAVVNSLLGAKGLSPSRVICLANWLGSPAA